MTFWQWLMGGIRPISLLAWLPVVGGAWFGGRVDLGTMQAAVGAMLVSGVANTLNNFVDRRADRFAGKLTVAVHDPSQGYLLVWCLVAALAQILWSNHYDNRLLALILCTSVLYSFVPNRLEFVKRVAVATIIASTVFLDAETRTSSLWLWATGVWLVILYRETMKDRPDWATDILYKFIGWRGLLADPWCISAPLLAGGLYLVSIVWAGIEPDREHCLMASAIGLTVIGYLHIRARHGRYRFHFRHAHYEGRLAVACSLASFAAVALGAMGASLVSWNLSSIVARSYAPCVGFDQLLARLHDALLWASIPILVMMMLGTLVPTLAFLAGVLFIGTCLTTQFAPRGRAT